MSLLLSCSYCWREKEGAVVRCVERSVYEGESENENESEGEDWMQGGVKRCNVKLETNRKKWIGVNVVNEEVTTRRREKKDEKQNKRKRAKLMGKGQHGKSNIV